MISNCLWFLKFLFLYELEHLVAQLQCSIRIKVEYVAAKAGIGRDIQVKHSNIRWHHTPIGWGCFLAATGIMLMAASKKAKYFFILLHPMFSKHCIAYLRRYNYPRLWFLLYLAQKKRHPVH